MTKLKISIPDKLYKELSRIALEHKGSKDKFVENALNFYFEAIDKESYAKSFQRAAKDKEMLEIAEEGMKEYFEMLCNFEKSDKSGKKNKN